MVQDVRDECQVCATMDRMMWCGMTSRIGQVQSGCQVSGAMMCDDDDDRSQVGGCELSGAMMRAREVCVWV